MEDLSVPTLEIKHLSKTFGGQRALNDVCFTINPGEVHGLLGQNGSGKSTLIKILAGFYTPDPGGLLYINSKNIKLPLKIGEFQKLGMSFVHQDLGLVPSLSILENLRVGKLASKNDWHISWSEETKNAQEIFKRFGLNINPYSKVSDLSSVERALLAIVRAVEDIRANEARQFSGRGLLILDEPTVFLPKVGVDQLFQLVREVVLSGISVLFVSHDLDEVLEITDRVTILRDGRVSKTAVTSQINKEQLVEMIIGRKMEILEVKNPVKTNQDIHVSIKNLTGEIVNNVTIELYKGEVLGLTGLVGSGFEEIPYLLFGSTSVGDGYLSIEGQSYNLSSLTPIEAIKAGIALIPADRHGAGGVDSLSIIDNLMLTTLGNYSNGYKLNRRKMLQESEMILKEYQVRPNKPLLSFHALSGGNQQKILIAKWLQTKPKLLLLHEPTQGVDIGARQQIFELIKTATNDGMSIICVSSDYEQLALICNRVVVFSNGSIVSVLSGNDITKDRITEQCYNSLNN